MTLDEAILLLQKTVKLSENNDQKHIDLGLVPTEQKPMYEEALIVSQLAIRDGKISRDEFRRKVNLDS